jgi:hypothetical protein
MNSKREKKLERLRDVLLDAQLDAAHYVRKLQAGEVEAGVRWADREVRTQVSLDLAHSSMAAERTKTMADSNRQLGLIVVPMTIANKAEWEKYALEAAQSKQIIDVKANPDGD